MRWGNLGQKILLEIIYLHLDFCTVFLKPLQWKGLWQ